MNEEKLKEILKMHYNLIQELVNKVEQLERKLDCVNKEIAVLKEGGNL